MKLDYLDYVSMKYGMFKVSEYLKTSGHEYAIYLIDISKHDLEFCDGMNNEELRQKSKEGLNLYSKGIHALYGERTVKESAGPVEVFMIEKYLWQSNDDQEKELLVFHEICHLLEKRKYYVDQGVIFSEYEIKIGNKLSELVNKTYNELGGFGDDDHHNYIFGAILFHYLRIYDSDNCYQLLSDSMIYNIGYDTTSIFKAVE